MTNGLILDTDIGYDPDDLFGLLLILNSPEVKLDLIITGDEVEGKRAKLLKKILNILNEDIEVVQGEDLGNKEFVIDEFIENESYNISQDYLTSVKKVLEKYDKVIYINIQGFSNLAKILDTIPESKEKLIIYQMGGAVDYIRRPNWTEHNVKIDINSAIKVLNSDIKLSLIMAQTTFNPIFKIDNNHEIFKLLESSTNEVHKILVKHCLNFNNKTTFWTHMHDPLAISVALGKDFVSFYESGIEIDVMGKMTKSNKKPKFKLSQVKSKDQEFMNFLKERLFFKG
ncbi:MAG: nucleoside hydrolase [Nanoarchaeota archaeon]|nr:nucleoside hydrolase [Nanoarchaeota archaeon]